MTIAAGCGEDDSAVFDGAQIPAVATNEDLDDGSPTTTVATTVPPSNDAPRRWTQRRPLTR